MTAVEDDAIADEIRIVQYVQVQLFSPVLLFGNALVVNMFFYLDWAAAVSSQAVYFLVAELLLLLPMLRSYLRLRGRPRPKRVSTRRIRLIEIYSFLMGLVWAVAVILMMSQLSRIDGAVIIVMMIMLGFGAAALTPSLPKASAAYSGP